jgi:hypothetical protein
MEKVTKMSFTQKADRAKEILSLVHTDVCDPLSTLARRGFEYFIIFTNDCTRSGYVYLMRHKTNSFDKFKKFKVKVEHRIGKLIKTLRLDRGGKYLLGEFKNYIVHHEIISQLTTPRTRTGH